MTHYDTLEVARGASPAVIRAAYKSLSQVWHPDRNSHRAAQAELQMTRLNVAYEVLSDSAKRKRYDAELAAMAESGNGAWRNAAGPVVEDAEFRADHNQKDASAAKAAGWWNAKKLAFAITAVAWGWVPFTVGMRPESGELLPVANLSILAVLVSAWVPARFIGLAVLGERRDRPALSWKKVALLLLSMCAMQTLIFFMASWIEGGLLGLLAGPGSESWSEGMYAANAVGVVAGVAIMACMYAAALMAVGYGLALIVVPVARSFYVSLDSKIVALVAGWLLVPALLLGNYVWALAESRNAASHPSLPQFVDPFKAS